MRSLLPNRVYYLTTVSLFLLVNSASQTRIVQGKEENGLTLVPQKPNGDASCPCLTASDVNITSGELEKIESNFPGSIPTNYGIGCQPHDIDSIQCLKADECGHIAPTPLTCDLSWCYRSWCLVDKINCGVQHTTTDLSGDERVFSQEQRHWSYGTCGHMDSFTAANRLTSLEGKTLNVAFNSNSGGWQGAYSPHGHFSIINKDWSGPLPAFIRQLALEGKFELNFTSPPAWLWEESKAFFGTSTFDYCVYATSLGYIDLCVAAYTITTKRASVANFFETKANPVYLITTLDETEDWENFIIKVKTVFRPFTWSTWGFIFLFCVPLLGFLMLLHENGAPGGSYPRTVPVRITDQETGRTRDEKRTVPMWQHIVMSVYMGFLAFFQESYGQSVVTVGGKIHLLGVSSFIMLILACYTANLAAIFTQDYSKTVVESVEDAIKLGYVFCSERKVFETVTSMKELNLKPEMFVPDPVSLGGDGKAGFNCPTCNARSRVFEQIQANPSDTSLYCNAAFASLEDIEIMHSNSLHCNKIHVGLPVTYENTGFPLYKGQAEALFALLNKVRNDGELNSFYVEAKPSNNCAVIAKSKAKNTALNIGQLTGVWVIVFGFVLLGLIGKLISRTRKLRRTEKKGELIRSSQRYDQWGNPTDTDLEEQSQQQRKRRSILGLSFRGKSGSTIESSDTSQEEVTSTSFQSEERDLEIVEEQKLLKDRD